MKILFASLPADGHFNPLTGIAVHLRDRGHDVRWYAGPAYGSKIDRLDMPWFPYQRATEVMAGNLNDLFPERAALKGPKLISFDLDKFFVSQVENHFDDVVAIRDGVAVRRTPLRRRVLRRAARGGFARHPGLRRRADDGDAGLAEPTTVLRTPPRPHTRRQAAARDRPQAACERHEGRHHPVQRDPRSARHRPDLARRLPARADAASPPGLPQRVAGTGVPRLPATRRTPSTSDRWFPLAGRSARTPRSRTSSSIPRGKSWRCRRAPSTTVTRGS